MDVSLQRVSKDYWHGKWDGAHRESKETWLRKYADELLCGLPLGGTLVDVGCGACQVTSYLAASFETVHAIDFSPTMLAAARERLRALGITNVQLAYGLAERLPPEMRGVDAVVSNGVAQYLDSQQLRMHLQECQRVLKPAGVVCVALIPNAQVQRLWYLGLLESPSLSAIAVARRYLAAGLRSVSGRLRRDPFWDGIGRWYTMEEVKARAEESGFDIECRYSWYFPYRFHALLRKKAATVAVQVPGAAASGETGVDTVPGGGDALASPHARATGTEGRGTEIHEDKQARLSGDNSPLLGGLLAGGFARGRNGWRRHAGLRGAGGNDLDVIERSFREHCRGHDEVTLSVWLSDATLCRYRDWVPEPRPGETTLLDIGCYQPSIGYYVMLGWQHVVGIAKEEGELVSACSYATGPGGRADIFIMDAERERLPVDDASVDAVVMMEVLEHFALDPMHALIEANRVLRPQGRLVLSTPNAASYASVDRILRGYSPFEGLEFNGFSSNRHNRLYDNHELTEMLGAAGFQVEGCLSRTYQGGRRGLRELVVRGAVNASDRLQRLVRQSRRVRQREEFLFAVARKSGPPKARYPECLYLRPALWPQWYEAIRRGRGQEGLCAAEIPSEVGHGKGAPGWPGPATAEKGSPQPSVIGLGAKVNG